MGYEHPQITRRAGRLGLGRPISGTPGDVQLKVSCSSPRVGFPLIEQHVSVCRVRAPVNVAFAEESRHRRDSHTRRRDLQVNARVPRKRQKFFLQIDWFHGHVTKPTL